MSIDIGILFLNDNTYENDLKNLLETTFNITETLFLNYNYNNPSSYSNNYIKIGQYLKHFKYYLINTIFIFYDTLYDDNLDNTYISFDYLKLLANIKCNNLLNVYKSKVNFNLPLFKYKFYYNKQEINIDYTDINLGCICNFYIIDNYCLIELIRDILRNDTYISLFSLLIDNSSINIYSDKNITKFHFLYSSDKNYLSFLYLNNDENSKNLLIKVYNNLLNRKKGLV